MRKLVIVAALSPACGASVAGTPNADETFAETVAKRKVDGGEDVCPGFLL